MLSAIHSSLPPSPSYQPFLTPDGEVDLSGGGGRRKKSPGNGSSHKAGAANEAGSAVTGEGDGGAFGMSLDTTVNFSLPSASNGETDATGLCTIKLLTNLTVSRLIDNL